HSGSQQQLSQLDWSPSCDVKETDTHFEVHADLPGIPREGIKVEVNEGVLTLSGERKQEKEETKDKWHRIERSYGKFSRSMTLPENVDPSAIDASYKDGVLVVS